MGGVNSKIPKELSQKLSRFIADNFVPLPKEKPALFKSIMHGAKSGSYRSEECLAEMSVPLQSAQKRSLDEAVGQVGQTFQQCLFRLIDERGLSNAQVYKRAGIDRKLFSKIQCSSDYRPSKKTVFALAIALELNIDEAADMLARAGLAFSPSSVSDLIVRFFIENGIYDMYAVNEALYEYNEPTLC